MRVALIGGKLQGIEASYLAKKAGFEVVLIDKKPDIPACWLADEVHTYDVINNAEECSKLLTETDLIIPTLEDYATLEAINTMAKKIEIPYAYDASSYAVSQSKNKSNELFTRLEVPIPENWPDCGLPVMCKPSFSSGSRGVKKITTPEDMDTFLKEIGKKKSSWLIQEYLEGTSYSLEVIGWQGNFLGIQVTKIDVDDNYDCKRVTAPSGIPVDLEKELEDISVKIATALDLHGIMDVEAIHTNDELKLLEIDARLPSQTPTVVFHSTGINMVELLTSVFCKNSMPEIIDVKSEEPVIFEHVKAASGLLESGGEHIMSEAGALKSLDSFFGAEEAITDYQPGCNNWAATLIIKGKHLDDVRRKHSSVIKNITRSLNLTISEGLRQEINFS
ncbi:MAG: 3-methylornithine--L-lysine ligase PylC [Spirochaetota bacterium]|nr:MAG: 3-methylornithine--L-lysine ligase PylC [Spirochaetota bacterium]